MKTRTVCIHEIAADKPLMVPCDLCAKVFNASRYKWRCPHCEFVSGCKECKYEELQSD